MIGFDIGPGAFIMGNMEITSGVASLYEMLTVGSHCLISTHVTVNADDRVTIGSNVCIGPYVLIYTGGHRIGPPGRRAAALATRPVTIEEGAWIRVGAIILPGVTIGRGSIVGAGAVVSQDVPANAHVEGNPAQVVRTLA